MHIATLNHTIPHPKNTTLNRMSVHEPPKQPPARPKHAPTLPPKRGATNGIEADVIFFAGSGLDWYM